MSTEDISVTLERLRDLKERRRAANDAADMAFALLVALNTEMITLDISNVRSKPDAQGYCHRFDRMELGSSFACGVCHESKVPGSELGERCDAAHEVWRQAAIEANAAKEHYEKALRMELDR